jgi:hypothetical protein
MIDECTQRASQLGGVADQFSCLRSSHPICQLAEKRGIEIL